MSLVQTGEGIMGGPGQAMEGQGSEILTLGLLAEIVGRIRARQGLSEICERLGIKISTYRRWMKWGRERPTAQSGGGISFGEFRHQIEQARRQARSGRQRFRGKTQNRQTSGETRKIPVRLELDVQFLDQVVDFLRREGCNRQARRFAVATRGQAACDDLDEPAKSLARVNIAWSWQGEEVRLRIEPEDRPATATRERGAALVSDESAIADSIEGQRSANRSRPSESGGRQFETHWPDEASSDAPPGWLRAPSCEVRSEASRSHGPAFEEAFPEDWEVADSSDRRELAVDVGEDPSDPSRQDSSSIEAEDSGQIARWIGQFDQQFPPPPPPPGYDPIGQGEQPPAPGLSDDTPWWNQPWWWDRSGGVPR